MNTSIKNDELFVELNQTEKNTLNRAKKIGVLLTKLHQETGKPLTDAIDSILGSPRKLEDE